jgi:hypothetical protein
MKTNKPWGRWWVVVGYAVAMAWVEAAVVLYLRTMLNRIEPYQPNPLPDVGVLGYAELIREAATLVMLATVGWLAGRTTRSRVGFAVLAFGVWDICYYLFLRPLTGWPRSLLDWDVLFLLPLPWWGPVLAPTAIAALMVVGSSLVALNDTPGRPFWPGRLSLATTTVGVMLMLYVFMADAIRVAPQGEQALRELLPARFLWPLYLLGLGCLGVPVVELAVRLARGRVDEPLATAGATTE